MKIFLSYENSKRDFNGRLFLASELLKKKEIQEVHIGWHKNIFFELFKSIFSNKEKIIIIDCNNYDYKFPFMKLLSFFGCEYYVIDEEEIGISYMKNEGIIKLRFLSEQFGKLIQGKFVLGDKNYEVAKRHMNSNISKIYKTGHPRIDFIKNVLDNKKILDKNFFIKDDYVLVCLPENIFRSFLLLLKIKKNSEVGSLAIRNYEFRKGRYKYVREFLINLKKMVKQNSKYKFILRVHPTDKEYEKKYESFFKDCDNMIFNTESNVLYFISQSKLLICGLDFVAVESHLLKKESISFLGNVFDYAKEYKGHFGSDLSNLNYCKDFDEFKKNFDVLIKKSDNQNIINKIDNKISTLLSYDMNASRNISNIIYEKSIKKNLKISLIKRLLQFVLRYCLKDIFSYLTELKKKKYYEIKQEDYKKFLDKFRFSPKKMFVYIFTKRNFLACLYKCLFYSNFSDHSAYRMSGQQQKIEKDDFELSLKLNHLNNKDFEAKYLKDGFYFKIKKKFNDI